MIGFVDSFTSRRGSVVQNRIAFMNTIQAYSSLSLDGKSLPHVFFAVISNDPGQLSD